MNPGGVPIYRLGATDPEDALIGGIGVAGVPTDQAEYAAFRGAFGTTVALNAGETGPVFTFPLPEPGNVFIEGIRVPFVGDVPVEPFVEQGFRDKRRKLAEKHLLCLPA